MKINTTTLRNAMNDAACAYVNHLGGSEDLPPLDWRVDASAHFGRMHGQTGGPVLHIRGQVGPEFVEGEAARVAEQWATALGLAEDDRGPDFAGALFYVGVVEPYGDRVEVWCIHDEDMWNGAEPDVGQLPRRPRSRGDGSIN